MGSNLPGAVSNTADPRQVRAVDTESYSPAEQLQREKSGNTEVRIIFCFSSTLTVYFMYFVILFCCLMHFSFFELKYFILVFC